MAMHAHAQSSAQPRALRQSPRPPPAPPRRPARHRAGSSTGGRPPARSPARAPGRESPRSTRADASHRARAARPPAPAWPRAARRAPCPPPRGRTAGRWDRRAVIRSATLCGSRWRISEKTKASMETQTPTRTAFGAQPQMLFPISLSPLSMQNVASRRTARPSAQMPRQKAIKL